MAKHYSVAIDGPAGAGKSTIAKALAKELGFHYVDTGAIYRTLGYFFDLIGIGPKDIDGITKYIDECVIEIEWDEDGSQHMFLNETDVSEEIRTPEISKIASAVSAHGLVRDALLDMQRNVAKTHDVIMDGRDIGSVVLPRADVKFFLTASPEVRAQRRFEELQAKGSKDTYAKVLKEVNDRDHADMTRAVAPLKQTKSHILVDTSDMTIEQVIAHMGAIVREKCKL
ncbi:MAG: (d)CMP kinase [Oscillospiraceae bacterium]|jgi:cytidylate kinase|nr:(d)CMP kinase [Oscillospiraceae bacterium]